MANIFDFSIAWGPFITVALGNFVLSWVYYSPISPFFKKWQQALGIDPNKKGMSEEDKKAMPRMMGGAVLGTLLLSYGLQVLSHSLNLTSAVDGMKLGFIVWLTFAVTHSLNTQFEGRKPAVLLINDFWFLLTYVGFGAIVAMWG